MVAVKLSREALAALRGAAGPGNRAKALEAVQRYQEASRQLEVLCRERGIAVPEMAL